MNKKSMPLVSLVLSAFFLMGGAHVPPPPDEQPGKNEEENAIVKAGAKDGLKFLQGFNSRFRFALEQKGFKPGDIQCVGCDALDGKSDKAPPKELSYFFPGTKSEIGQALILTWIADGERAEDSTLTFRPPSCSAYPQPCNARPSCPAGPTPYCRKSKTLPCATAGSCL